MFFNSKKVFAFRDPIKYFEVATSELGRSSDGKQTNFKSSLINKYFKDFSNHRKKTNREVAFSHKPPLTFLNTRITDEIFQQFEKQDSFRHILISFPSIS